MNFFNKKTTQSLAEASSIRRWQAVIEFDLDGTIRDANENFLKTLGYTLAEIKGRKHDIFVAPAERGSEAYRQFWAKLARGEHDENQYLRIGKGGREVWIQASYNPILDPFGKAYKVVKYATDITASKENEEQMEFAIAEVGTVVQAAKDRDLTKRIAVRNLNPKNVELCEGVNELVDTLAGLVGQVAVAAQGIDTAAKEISMGADDLSKRTEEQASSLEETAATTEELAASVKASATNARNAATLASEATTAAQSGGDIAGEAVRAMARIEDASQKIQAITRVIDDIAFQTNLLALNAAVEAARAGEAGKGFAVVASEVRTLAQRSGEAAKDISGLINNSSVQVASGVKLVKEAGSALSEIVGSSTSVSASLDEIKSASREQAHGIEEVARVVAHMDEMTQQNSSVADQSAKVAADLQQATEALQALVETFRIRADRSGTAGPLGSAVPRAA